MAQSVLTNLVCIIAVIHMAIGCAWHHGIHGPCECSAKPAKVDRPPFAGEREHCCHHAAGPVNSLDPVQSGYREDVGSIIVGSQHQHYPEGCRDDGCSYTQSDEFETLSLARLPVMFVRSSNLTFETGGKNNACRSRLAHRFLSVPWAGLRLTSYTACRLSSPEPPLFTRFGDVVRLS